MANGNELRFHASGIVGAMSAGKNAWNGRIVNFTTKIQGARANYMKAATIFALAFVRARFGGKKCWQVPWMAKGTLFQSIFRLF